LNWQENSDIAFPPLQYLVAESIEGNSQGLLCGGREKKSATACGWASGSLIARMGRQGTGIREKKTAPNRLDERFFRYQRLTQGYF
jgi:hypothetical protein